MAMPNDFTLSSIWDDFPTLKTELNEVIAVINDSWEINFSEIDQAIRSQLTAGKLLRPALTLFFTELSVEPDQNSHQQAIKMAASVELLHLATLIHDDIIDESKLRRGSASIQSAFGKDTAVYAGDYLLTGMFSLISQVNKPNLNTQVIHSIQRILFGELYQKQNRYNTANTFENYVKQMDGKTSALFQLAMFYGIHSGTKDASNTINELVNEFGRKLGISFQLFDDYLDFSNNANSNMLGKPKNQDIRNGIYTAPVLFSLEDEQYRKPILDLLNLRDDISDLQLDELQELILATSAMERLEDLLYKYQQDLNDLIERLPAPALQQNLQRLVNKLIERQS
ncbi:polyprenyl synthetase family protein [Convivina intestini]|uniref:polyprenyl synthetase family protein n=1 Tax=Convivina intestini TaxID=1505726 RepID=UPI00200F2E33|nr:polyprenyl synthetase family protein [Convivina intestini]CAH1854034.1 hypothetical protein R078131_00904 [Convivina intestini]